ncbi:hypothetical protein RGQ29_032484 [Quercus rubra]|uniref:Proteasome assembly chaperone 2 n=1 Tax=Quercus rubra TaxID=3512 RepID=A0AAN7DVF1_QUERU|nr:hypothetical protein RGQ29_032484 [Quercus rubra]
MKEGKKPHDQCSTLLLPALSIGNVGQLAMDLMVASTRAERIGFFDDPFLLPCVGNDAYGPQPQGQPALPLEAYDSSSNALTLVQQRSPFVKGKMVEFAKNLADFAAATGKKHAVVLSSLDFGRCRNIDMSSTNSDGTDDYCEQLGWKRLQEYNPTQRCWKYLGTLAEGNSLQDDNPLEDELEEEDYYPSLPFAAHFSFTRLLCYCSEGDNIQDAFHLAEAACKLLGLSPSNFHGMFPLL